MSSTSETSSTGIVQQRIVRIPRVHRALVSFAVTASIFLSRGVLDWLVLVKLRYANKSLSLAALGLILVLPSCGVEFCASVPVLDSISPASVQAGGPDFTLTLKGRNFHSDSSVLWNGFYVFGKTVNANEIQVTVPAANILDEGSAQVWVVNDPGGTNLNGPCGGGPSAKRTFTITL